MIKQPCVYLMTNKQNGTIYTGVTSSLIQRVFQHRNGVVKGFTKKYNCKILVWYELHETMESAITREKQIKSGSRNDKLKLIEVNNLEWKDLYESLV